MSQIPIQFALEGGLPLALARGLSVAALLSVFGTLVFWTFVVPRVVARCPPETVAGIDRQALLAARAGGAVCLLATCWWLVLQAADIADADSVAKALRVIPVVLSRTWFGRLVMVQEAVLLGLLAMLAGRPRPWRRRAVATLAGIATALQAGHSHAAAMYGGPSLLLANDVLHLLAAGAWLGGLLPLLLLVRGAPPKVGATAARWFSPLGKLCVVVLGVSAGVQGWVMIASIPGLIGTAYGLMGLLKLTLFGVLLGFAAANRYRLAPAMLTGEPGRAKRALLRSIAVQAGFGLAVIVAAAVLSELPPAMHVPPVWPLPVQLSLDAVREDAEFRREVIEAALALAGAAALLVVAALARRVRWPLTGLALTIACLALPHFDLLLADAYPTSFYRSPTGFAATTIAAGAALYPSHCAVCHGPDGRGDGPAARSLPIPPADLTAAHLWMHTDGELYWWLAHGIAAPSGAVVMPGFDGILSDDERWDAIDYIRAHNAGVAMRDTGTWAQPVRAPDFAATCGDRTRGLADFRGRFVRLVVGPGTQNVGVLTVGTDGGACSADDPAILAAYAVVSGISPRKLAGTQFLIDGDGWLRAVNWPGAKESWDDPGALADEIKAIRGHPIAAAAPMDMKM